MFSQGSSKRRGESRVVRRKLGAFERLEEQVLLAADLQLGISTPQMQVEAGETLTYEFAHANIGDTTPTGVELRALVPANTSFDSASDTAGWDCGIEGIVCSLSLPEPYVAGSVDFPVIVDDPLASRATLIQVVGLISDDGENGLDDNRSNNSATAITDISRETHDLQASIVADVTEAIPGLEITFTITYDNQGDATPSGAQLRMNVPENTSETVKRCQNGETVSGTVSGWGWTNRDHSCMYIFGNQMHGNCCCTQNSPLEPRHADFRIEDQACPRSKH